MDGKRAIDMAPKHTDVDSLQQLLNSSSSLALSLGAFVEGGDDAQDVSDDDAGANLAQQNDTNDEPKLCTSVVIRSIRARTNILATYAPPAFTAWISP